MPDKVVGISSDAWQRTSDAAEASAFLQRVATMPVARELAARSLALMALRHGESVLDVGCGTGVLLPLLAEAVGPTGKVTGIDHGVPFVDEARQRVGAFGWVHVDVGDAYTLPYAEGSFDVAHCERLLMHLDDPTAALPEMRRVVRAGGRVVAAEPAWSTVVIDHADHDAVDLLISHHNTSTRNPHMGLELNRRMAEAGLEDRYIEAVPICSRDYAEFRAYGLDLPAAAESLAASGRLPLARSQPIPDDLVAASLAGTYFGFGASFLALGRVPEA